MKCIYLSIGVALGLSAYLSSASAHIIEQDNNQQERFDNPTVENLYPEWCRINSGGDEDCGHASVVAEALCERYGYDEHVTFDRGQRPTNQDVMQYSEITKTWGRPDYRPGNADIISTVTCQSVGVVRILHRHPPFN